MEKKRLTKSNNKVFAGVLGGIANWLGIDPTVVRIIYAAITLLSAFFPGVILYIVMAIIMPDAPNSNGSNQNDSDWSDF